MRFPRLTDSELIEWANTGGQPAGVAVDPKTGALFIADLAHGAIVSCKEEGGAMQLFVKDYEGTPLKVHKRVQEFCSPALAPSQWLAALRITARLLIVVVSFHWDFGIYSIILRGPICGLFLK